MNLGIETEFVAFRESLDNLDSALASITAILNKHGRGRIYIGVAPTGDVVGMDPDWPHAIAQIQRAIDANIEPAINPTYESLEDERSAAYLRISFHGDNAPYTCKGRFFMRAGNANREMANEELERSSRYNASAFALHGVPPSDRPLAECVADLLGESGSKGNGEARLRETCEQMGVRLTIAQDAEGVWVRFEKPNAHATSSSNIAPTANRTTAWASRPKKEQAVCDYLLANGASITTEMAQALGIPNRTLRDVLARLRHAGLVEAFGADKNRTYDLKSSS